VEPINGPKVAHFFSPLPPSPISVRLRRLHRSENMSRMLEGLSGILVLRANGSEPGLSETQFEQLIDADNRPGESLGLTT